VRCLPALLVVKLYLPVCYRSFAPEKAARVPAMVHTGAAQARRGAQQGTSEVARLRQGPAHRARARVGELAGDGERALCCGSVQPQQPGESPGDGGGESDRAQRGAECGGNGRYEFWQGRGCAGRFVRAAAARERARGGADGEVQHAEGAGRPAGASPARSVAIQTVQVRGVRCTV
jgi:hypothetical protein